MSWGAIGGAAGGISGSITSAVLAAQQRRWVRRMRKTAYQDTMADMRKAGLNPILAYKTGPTPIGSAAAGMSQDIGQAMASGVNAAVRAKKAPSEISRNRAETSKARFDALLKQFQGRIEADRFNAKIGDAQVRFINAQARFTSAKDQMLRTELPRAEAVKRMDESPAGQFMNQSTTQIRRATGAVGAILGGGAAAQRILK